MWSALDGLPREELQAALENDPVRAEQILGLLTPRMSKYCPEFPTAKQAAALLINERELLFGGAAGGGKSSWILMAALQYVDYPEYSALLLRRTYADLALPDAIMNRLHHWLTGQEKVHWNNNTKTFTFPAGSTITFGYMQTEADKYRYQGSRYDFLGFDELTQFPEGAYTYLASRLRRAAGSSIPPRIRSTSNPGGVYGEWVKQRFITSPVYFVKGQERRRYFVQAKLVDNPYLDQEEYIESLSLLDPVTRAQLLDGDWGASFEGGMFNRAWFHNKIIPAHLLPELIYLDLCRYWDIAGTEPSAVNRDPDWTAGALVARGRRGTNWSGLTYLIDMARCRRTPHGTEQFIREVTDRDKQLYGDQVFVRMEQEPGGAGKAVIDYYCREVLDDVHFLGIRPEGDKRSRATPLSSQAQNGNIWLVAGEYLGPFLEELQMFPTPGAHDDQVDAFSGAYRELIGGEVAPTTMYQVPVKGRRPTPKWNQQPYYRR